MSRRLLVPNPGEEEELVVEFSDAEEDPPLSDLVMEAVRAAAHGESRRFGRVSIILTSDERLTDLNSSYRGLDEPTDVLAFDLADSGDSLVEGDIYISLQSAAAQAVERGQTPAEEVVRLAVHGFLHLCGWDHENDESLDSMVERGEIFVQSTVRSK
jgi:probable rRNA maturation factor